MKWLNFCLLLCVAALIIEAITFGTDISTSRMTGTDGGPSHLGMQVVGIRCGLLFMAMIGGSIWFHATESTSQG